jgi:hypothetical protein
VNESRASRVGVRATGSDVEVELTIDVPGTLQGFGSAIPATEESFTDLRHRLCDGRALAVIRPSGMDRINVTAAGAGLQAASVELEVG